MGHLRQSTETTSIIEPGSAVVLHPRDSSDRGRHNLYLCQPKQHAPQQSLRVAVSVHGEFPLLCRDFLLRRLVSMISHWLAPFLCRALLAQ
jgi:hypothetical protein